MGIYFCHRQYIIQKEEVFFRTFARIVAVKNGLISASSDVVDDYKCGAVRFRDSRDGELVNTLNQHEISDCLLFRYDLYHDITPVDPELNIDCNSNDGRWSFVLPLKKI
jgi:hypothetical protein